MKATAVAKALGWLLPLALGGFAGLAIIRGVQALIPDDPVPDDRTSIRELEFCDRVLRTSRSNPVYRCEFDGVTCYVVSSGIDCLPAAGEGDE